MREKSFGLWELDFSLVKSDYDAKRQQLIDEMDSLMEHAVNYEEQLELYEEKAEIDWHELEWNTAKDQRHFDDIEHSLLLIDLIIRTVDDVISAGDDKKKVHQVKKEIETLIASIRRKKNESKEVIEREQQVIDEADSALDLLDAIRGKYS